MISRIIFYLFIFIFFLNSCSFQNTGGLFKDRIKELETEIAKKNSKIVFSESKKFKKEISGIFEGKISEPIVNISWLEKNFANSNFIPHLKYEDQKRLLYKSKKLGKNKFRIEESYFEPLIYENRILLYDPSGNIYNFSISQEKLTWKFNFYKKRYKNLPIKLKLKILDSSLIISDNLGYLYKLDIDSGNLIWAKNYGIPFRSNIKTDGQSIFLLNQDNKFYKINSKDGEMELSFETFPTLLKSEQETNISLDTEKNNLYFVTSTGQLYSVNYKTNNLNWLLDLSLTRGQTEGLFFSSPIIFNKDKLFLSNSVATYSINSMNGRIIWQLPFSTYIRPIALEKFLIVCSKDGFILNLDPKTGKVIWSKNLFKDNKKIKLKKVGFITSLLFASNKILASTSNGFILFIDHTSGEVISSARVSRKGFFSNPSLVNKKIYIVDKSIKVLVLN